MINQFNVLITAYSLLILVGGVIGYFVASSIASLLMSTIFAILLIGSLFIRCRQAVFALLGVLALFFAYRWYMGKFMPSGMMCIVTLAVLAYAYYIQTSERA
jgi:uncharacterized membrane protein (UPF0136 family)